MAMTTDARDLAKTIWDYMLLSQEPRKADIIVVLGSNDLRVAERAAELYIEDYGPLIITSGASGVLTRDMLREMGKRSEAQLFAEVMVRKGVPREKILLEDRSTNTGENIQFVRQLVEAKHLKHDLLLLVQKPYMERRTHATMRKVWPEQNFTVTSPQVAFDEYIGPVNPSTDHLQIMVGDLQRLKLYGVKGYQKEQHIPADVWRAYEILTTLGYDKHLVR